MVREWDPLAVLFVGQALSCSYNNWSVSLCFIPRHGAIVVLMFGVELFRNMPARASKTGGPLLLCWWPLSGRKRNSQISSAYSILFYQKVWKTFLGLTFKIWILFLDISYSVFEWWWIMSQCIMFRRSWGVCFMLCEFRRKTDQLLSMCCWHKLRFNQWRRRYILISILRGCWLSWPVQPALDGFKLPSFFISFLRVSLSNKSKVNRQQGSGNPLYTLLVRFWWNYKFIISAASRNPLLPASVTDGPLPLCLSLLYEFHFSADARIIIKSGQTR